MESSLFQKQQFYIKIVLMMHLFLIKTQSVTSQDINWWTGVVWIIVMFFYQLFELSFWWHPFTAEDPIVSK